MSTFETIGYEVEDRVARIYLSRPQAMNAFNRQLRRELLEAIEIANQDDEVRVVVVGSVGKGFSAGADLKSINEANHKDIETEILVEYRPIFMTIYNSPKLFISSIRGVAAGIGAALAMVCDLTIMSENASIYLAFSAVALVPDGGTSWHLVNTLGYKRAIRAMVEAEKLDAQTCLAWGLTNRVVAPEFLDSQTQAWAEAISNGAPLAQELTKKLAQQALSRTMPEVFDLEANRQNIASQSEDAKEAVSAFFENRKPEFSGKAPKGQYAFGDLSVEEYLQLLGIE